LKAYAILKYKDAKRCNLATNEKVTQNFAIVNARASRSQSFVLAEIDLAPLD
jgi:hypothetical protein